METIGDSFYLTREECQSAIPGLERTVRSLSECPDPAAVKFLQCMLEAVRAGANEDGGVFTPRMSSGAFDQPDDD